MESDGGGTIVVLAGEHDGDARAIVTDALTPEDLRGTRLIFRTGNTQHINDLERVAAAEAAAVIVLCTKHPTLDRLGLGHPH